MSIIHGTDYIGPERQLTAKPEVDQTPIPLQDYVIIQPDRPKTTEGGLVLPESSQQPYAKVVAVGPGCFIDGGFYAPRDFIKPGDRVLLDGDVTGFEWLGERYHQVRARYVTTVLPGEMLDPQILRVPALSLQ